MALVSALAYSLTDNSREPQMPEEDLAQVGGVRHTKGHHRIVLTAAALTLSGLALLRARAGSLSTLWAPLGCGGCSVMSAEEYAPRYDLLLGWCPWDDLHQGG